MDTPFRPDRAASDAAPPIHQATQIVRIRIAFSARYISAKQIVDERLQVRLKRSGLSYQLTGTRLLMLGIRRAVTPADWTAVVGWLLCQPEVEIVAREWPVSRRCHD